MKTNAARILEQLNIPYELLTYDVDPNDMNAGHIAAKLGLNAKQVFKTLVLEGDRHGVCFAVIPANTHLNLKSLARLSSNRKISPVPLKALQPLTGYIRGGITVFGSKKAYPVFVDETIQQIDKVAVSAGIRGQMLLLAANQYLYTVEGTLGAIAEDKLS